MFFIELKQCGSPPESDFSTWTTEYKLGENKFYGGMEVKYTCIDKYSFRPDHENVVKCRQNGTWSQNYAPICSQSFYCLKKSVPLNMHTVFD